ncbi:MAG: SDR family NAD(P)-dependent oxidoreductase [Caulobacteraceae bacterium]
MAATTPPSPFGTTCARPTSGNGRWTPSRSRRRPARRAGQQRRIARYGLFADQTPADFSDQIDINLRGVVLGAYLGHARLKNTPGSRLINIASAASLSGSPRLAVYSATKFAVGGSPKRSTSSSCAREFGFPAWSPR